MLDNNKSNKSQKMINGIVPSEYPTLRLTHTNHYRKLTEISTQQPSNFSRWGEQLKTVVRRRKNNHENWKTFMRKKVVQKIERDNGAYVSKLQQIHASPSRYAPSPPEHTPAETPSNFYQRRKRQEAILHQNPQIARRIINVSCTLSRQKDEEEFRRTRMMIMRMQKFNGILRMTQRQGKWRVKTQNKSQQKHPWVSTDKSNTSKVRKLKLAAISSKLMATASPISPLFRHRSMMGQPCSP